MNTPLTKLDIKEIKTFKIKEHLPLIFSVLMKHLLLKNLYNYVNPIN